MEQEIYNSPVTIRKQTTKFVGKSNDLIDFTTVLKERGVAGFNTWARDNDRYGLDLRGIHLSNVDLHGIDLTKARLDEARLFKVNFENASTMIAPFTDIFTTLLLFFCKSIRVDTLLLM